MAHAHHKTDSHTVDFQVDPVVRSSASASSTPATNCPWWAVRCVTCSWDGFLLDLDFTTDATPDQTVALIKKWADNFWEIGRVRDHRHAQGRLPIEITTYRAEAYDPDSRKPVVAFGTSLTDDLLRRDFTINAMALRLPPWNWWTRSAGSATSMPRCWPHRARRRRPSPMIRSG